ncbi:type II toxin-antitoxin system VapC family toxin [Streptomyces sp. A7024]|uniref:Type II toxin-antitoxin system VapC family toxin n=1 Tax=Streptomyces coryli TaxID=1128680 RepID=A0A6G4UAP1_9ACTN|nr:type II toxin-antitoxin system VapC family toxin [Streptomyces coryli]
MIYLDSGALVKLIHEEKETAALADFLAERDEELVSCELAYTEVPRVVRKLAHDSQRRLSVEQQLLDDELAAGEEILAGVGMLVVDLDLLVRAGQWADDPHLGSLDSIHLAAALQLGPALSDFVTYDKALARAAAEAGLSVVRPK